MRESKTFQKESITVAFMIEQLRSKVGVEAEAATVLKDASGNNALAEKTSVTESHLHRPGLVLAGYTELFVNQRVQVLGNTEYGYLQSLSEEQRHEAFAHLVQFPLPCIVLTAGNRLEESLEQMAFEEGIPIYYTLMPTVPFIDKLRDFLNDQFALQQSIHGALVDVYGIGLLLTGQAGIGKSEVSLDLVERGHRLVADDVVIVTRQEGPLLMGSGTDLVQHFMEVRGLGLVDVRAMYGIRSIRFQKRVEVVVHMQPWDADEEYMRLAMVEDAKEIMGVELPLVKVPVTPGKSISVICETIAMTHLLRHYGYDPAKVFAERLTERIREGGPARPPARGIEYFEHDYE